MSNADQSSNYISGKTGDWEIVIGLEIHAQVLSSSKLFSGASTEFGKDPNHNVSLVDAAMPGMLPVINQTCIKRCGAGASKLFSVFFTACDCFSGNHHWYGEFVQGKCKLL